MWLGFFLVYSQNNSFGWLFVYLKLVRTDRFGAQVDAEVVVFGFYLIRGISQPRPREKGPLFVQVSGNMVTVPTGDGVTVPDHPRLLIRPRCWYPWRQGEAVFGTLGWNGDAWQQLRA